MRFYGKNLSLKTIVLAIVLIASVIFLYKFWFTGNKEGMGIREATDQLNNLSAQEQKYKAVIAKNQLQIAEIERKIANIKAKPSAPAATASILAKLNKEKQNLQ